MTAVARIDRSPAPTMTVGQFEAYLEHQSDPRTLELVAGRIILMANPTETHNQIAANIFAPLTLAMDRRRCRTYQSDMRVPRTNPDPTLWSAAARMPERRSSPTRSSSLKFFHPRPWT